jgi:hypothetical protein
MGWPPETATYEGHAYEMAPVRNTYERRAHERFLHKRHAYEMANGRYTPMGEARI